MASIHQKITLMRSKNDCEVAALATACGVSYDKAKDALNWQDLPGDIENPIFGNPWNLYRALIGLGFWKRNITLTDLLSGKCKAGKTIVLLKQSITVQHWAVYAGINQNKQPLFYWGDSPIPKIIPKQKLIEYFTNDGPCNCAFEVYKANVFRIYFERAKNFIKSKYNATIKYLGGIKK